MANENDIGGKVGLDITDFKANIAELNRQIKVIDSGFKAAAAGMDNWGESEEGLQQRIQSLNQITDLQRQKIANLTAQYEKVAAEKGETSKAAQDLQVRINRETEALNKNLKEMNKSTSALDNLGKESVEAAKQTEDLDKALEETTAELKTIGGNAATAAAAGITAVGVAATAAIGRLLNFANGTDRALNRLQTQTGVSANEMEEFRDIAEEIYTSNLGDSIEDVAASMATVRQVTKQTGEELESTTKQALLLRDTFGFEVNESINAVHSLMKQFGITAEEAFTLIAQGAQNGANKNGDMLDILNEYAPHFQALGLNAEEFTDILIQGAEDGAFSIDKIGDAIKEFNIRAKDGSESTSEAFEELGLNSKEMSAQFAAGGKAAQQSFKTVLKELNKIEDPLKRNSIGVGLFGAQFEDLEASAILALGDVQKHSDVTADTLQQINDIQYSDLGYALEGLKRQLVTSIAEPIGQQLIPRIKELVENVKNIDVTPIVNGFTWLIDNAGNIAAGAVAIGAGMLTWNVVSMVQGVVKAIKAWRAATQGMTIAQAALNVVMAANPVGLIITAVAALVAGIITLWHTNDGFRDALVSAWEAVKKAFVSVWDWVKKNWDTLLIMLSSPIAGALKLLYDMNPQFREWVNHVWKVIVETFKKLPQQVGDFFSGVIERIKQWGSDTFTWVRTEVPEIINEVVNFFKTLPGKVATEMTNALNKIKGWGTEFWTWITTKVPEFINGIIRFFSELPGKIAAKLSSVMDKIRGWIKDAITTAKTEVPEVTKQIVNLFSELPSKMIEIGKDIVRGMWEGIKDMGNWLKNKITGFADGVIDGFKEGLGIHSPSRVMRDEVGKMVGAGMAQGITDSARKVRSAMDSINGEVVDLPSGQLSAKASAPVSNHYNFEGMLAGANFVVRNDSDIKSIAKEVANVMQNGVMNSGRGIGVTGT